MFQLSLDDIFMKIFIFNGSQLRENELILFSQMKSIILLHYFSFFTCLYPINTNRLFLSLHSFASLFVFLFYLRISQGMILFWLIFNYHCPLPLLIFELELLILFNAFNPILKH